MNSRACSSMPRRRDSQLCHFCKISGHSPAMWAPKRFVSMVCSTQTLQLTTEDSYTQLLTAISQKITSNSGRWWPFRCHVSDRNRRSTYESFIHELQQTPPQDYQYLLKSIMNQFQQTKRSCESTITTEERQWLQCRFWTWGTNKQMLIYHWNYCCLWV